MGQEMSNKYYSVTTGRETGIFRSWGAVKPLVNGYPGAKYKSFKTLEEAQNYLDGVNTDKFTNPISDNKIIVYTDGSCVNKVGGFGYVIVKDDKSIPVSGKVPSYPTTNQVAELYAIYSTLYHLYKDDAVNHGLVIYTDSKYSIGCLTEWHYTWRKNGWINSKGESVANQKLIKAILDISKDINIEYRHVRAHRGHFYNEWADKLANEGRML